MGDNDRSELERLRLENAALKEQAATLTKQTRPSTFTEMLDLYHEYTSKPLRVQKPAQSTKGSYTNPKSNYVPDKLQPWTEFPGILQNYFGKLCKELGTKRLFESSSDIQAVGRKASDRLSSEQLVRTYTAVTLETTVRDVIKEILKDKDFKTSLNLEGGLKFEDHQNSLNELSEEVQEKKERPGERHFIPVDQFGIVERTDDIDTPSNWTTLKDILFLIEYKAAHKLTPLMLNQVLGNGDFNIKSMLNSPTYPTEKDAGEDYSWQMRTAAALSQIFGYMLRAGTEYGYISTGQSFIFLRVRKQDPTTLHYHLAVPNDEVEGSGPSRTSINQVLCFAFLALESEPRDQRWIREATQACGTWDIDKEEVVKQMSPVKSSREPKDGAYRSSTASKLLLSSSYKLRSRDLSIHNSFDGSSDVRGEETTIPYLIEDVSTVKSQITSCEGYSMPYCSHQCLLGLLRGSPMDVECPNYFRHPKGSGRRAAGTHTHTLDMESLQGVLRTQLAETMDVNCTPLRKQGARGAMFKLTIESHGYTLVGKGTVSAFVPELRFESQIYNRLLSIQGSIIPVCLGNIDCVYPYYYHFATEIVHFMLLSWAGESLAQNTNPELLWESNADQISAMHKQLRSLGVEHCDLGPTNVLWDEARNQLMLIDFERSQIQSEILKWSPRSPPIITKALVLTPSPRKTDEVTHHDSPTLSKKKRNRFVSVADAHQLRGDFIRGATL